MQARRVEQEKQLRDAEGFLEKMRAKKHRQLVQWKVKHEILRRSTLALAHELRRASGKGAQLKVLFEPKKHTDYRARMTMKSTWNIEQSLLDDLESER